VSEQVAAGLSLEPRDLVGELAARDPRLGSGGRPGLLRLRRRRLQSDPTTWADVDFDAMRIHVCRRFYKGRLGSPKKGPERTIVLTPQAREVLEGLPRKAS
jgi:hypothetical protein